MLKLPEDIISKYPHIQVKNSNIIGIIIPPNSLFTGGEILQSYHCLELVLAGSNTIFSDTLSQKIAEGDIQFRKRGLYQFHPSKEYSSMLFFVDDDFIITFLEQHIFTYSNETFDSPIAPFLFKSSNSINAQVNDAKEVITHPERYSHCIVKLSLLHILLNILAKEHSKTFVTYLKHITNNRKLELSYFMEKNFTRNLTLQQMAKETGRSLSAFKKDFSKTFGTSPLKWVMNKRLEHAYYLLQHSSNAVSEIAYQCGFENTSHFSRSYKLKYGVTPTASRK